MFADDTLLFFEASRNQAEKVKAVLDLYGGATGQSLNYNKCTMFIGEACPVSVQEEVLAALHVTSLLFEEKYLACQPRRVVYQKAVFRICRLASQNG